MERIKKTLEVYEKHAKDYVETTYPNVLQFQLTQFISYLPKGASILDIGCGSGKDAEYLAEEGFKVTAIDLSKNILKEAAEVVEASVEFMQMDMMDLKFDDESFEGVWCASAFLHIPKEYALETLKGFFRVLKPKGVLCLELKEGEGEKFVEYTKSLNEPRFFAFYKQQEMEQLLEETGFVVLKSFVEEVDDVNWLTVYCRKD